MSNVVKSWDFNPEMSAKIIEILQGTYNAIQEPAKIFSPAYRRFICHMKDHFHFAMTTSHGNVFVCIYVY